MIYWYIEAVIYWLNMNIKVKCKYFIIIKYIFYLTIKYIKDFAHFCTYIKYISLHQFVYGFNMHQYAFTECPIKIYKL